MAWQTTCLIALYSLTIQIICLTTTPTFQVTNKYIETGSYTLDTSAYYANSSMSGVEWQTFSISYANNHSSYSQAQLSIQSINFQISSSLIINTTIVKNYLSTSSLNVALLSNKLNQLQALQIRYLVINSGFTKLVIFYNVFIRVTGSAYPLTSTSPYISYITGIPPINMNGTMRYFLVWDGLNATVTSLNNQLSIQTTATLFNSITLKINIQTPLTDPIGFMGMTFALIIYNEEVVATWPFPAAKLHYADVSGSGAAASFLNSSTIFQSFNTFWGINSFAFNNQSFFQFDSNFIPQISLVCTSSNPFLSVAFSMLAFQFKECDTTTPFYLSSQDQCYDVCPPRYYNDNTLYTCANCPNDCYQCLPNNTCTVCNATTDYRVLDSSTGRCTPLSGYYDDGTNNSTAYPCSVECRTCTGTPGYCTSCPYNATFLSNNSCPPCMLHCDSCNSSFTCFSCHQNYTYQNLSCVPNISIANNCSTISNCASCNITNQSLCSSCSLGYNLINNSCLSKCGNGIVIAPEQCDNGNNTGTGCSANCTIEDGYSCIITNLTSNCSQCPNRTYTDSTHQCFPCFSYACLTCNSMAQCLSCSPSDFRTLNINTCVPIDKYYDDGHNSIALPCNSNCQTCSGSSNLSCLSCLDGNALDNSSCINCDAASGTVGCKTCVKTKVTFSCSSCFTGSLSSGICSSSDSSPSSQSSSNNNTLLLAILLPILFCLLSCCLIIFCLWRRRKNAENKVEEEQQQNEEKANVQKAQLQNNIPKLSLTKIDHLLMKPNETEQNELSLEELRISKMSAKKSTRKGYSLKDSSEMSDSMSYENGQGRGR